MTKPDQTERPAGPALHVRRAVSAIGIAAVVVTACVRTEPPVEEEAGPLLTLRVETPEALDWGRSGELRLTLVNDGDSLAEGVIVQVFVPDWLEFGSVEPSGTAVTVVSGDEETSLQYQVTDSLPPGDSRVIIQHLRVADRPAPPVGQDSLETVQFAPLNNLVRARLLSLSGEPVGGEIQATLNFVGWSGAVAPARDSVPDTTSAGNDTLPGPTGARTPDTTQTHPWR